MKLHEFEGKKLFAQCGIPIPRGTVINSPDELDRASISFDQTAVKAQVLSGKRARLGGIILCHGITDTKKAAAKMLNKTINNERVLQVLVEERLPIQAEYYLAVTYDTRTRTPVALASTKGGSEVENQAPNSWPIDMHDGFQPWMARTLLTKAGFPNNEINRIAQLLIRLSKCFFNFDARLCEINPLTLLEDGELLADDAKIILDDDALVRHKFNFSARASISNKSSAREKKARQIDAQDHRGVAGKTYYDLDGDIAILASGGGELHASMDVLLALGEKPANFTEYSGNPPAEKVERLTKIALSKPGLSGCWVVGGTANFTDIYETLRGFMQGLLSLDTKPDYPIVIRRWGPRAKEAFEYINKLAKKESLNIYLFGQDKPVTESAKQLVELVRKYRSLKKHKKS